MTAWAKMEHSKYDGKCNACDQPYTVGNPLWYIKGAKGYFCSEGCLQRHAGANGITLDRPSDALQGTKTGQTGPEVSNDHPHAVCVVKAKEMALCSVCGGNVPEGELAVFIDRDGVEWTICTLCRRMAKAQRNLKLLGLWKPVKREDAQP